MNNGIPTRSHLLVYHRPGVGQFGPILIIQIPDLGIDHAYQMNDLINGIVEFSV